MTTINPETGRKIKIGGPTFMALYGNNLKPKSARGSSTKGWKEDAPKKGKEREKLYEQCGDSCFLFPSELKFPICKACRKGKCDCKIDCRGATAARIRAAQYKYGSVEKVAKQKQQTCARKK